MIAHRGFLGRSVLLLAMASLIPEVNEQVARAERLQAMLQRAVKLFDPGERQAVLLALEVDVRASCEAGESETEACRRLCEQVEAWINRGRKAQRLRQQWTGKGLWHYRVRFHGPGNYSAEVFQVYDLGTNDERVVDRWMSTPIATKAAALQLAEQRALDLHELEVQAERLGGAMGHDVRPEVAALLRDALGDKRGIGVFDDLVNHGPAEITGETESGPTLTAADIRRAASVLEENALPKDADGMYRVPRFDDPEVQARFAEQDRAGRAFSEAFAREMGHTLADIDKVTIETGPDSPPLRVGPSWVERHLRAGLTPDDLLPGPHQWPGEVVNAPMFRGELPTFDGHALARRLPDGSITSTRPTIDETEFQRMQRLAFNTSSDRAAERFNRIRRQPIYEQPAAPAPRLDPPRYSAVPKPPRPPKSPEVKAEQRKTSRARARTKARRGW